MKVLIVGGGGREHAIAWKCSQSKRVTELYAAPGNAGIAQLATCVDISVMDAEKLVAFAKEKEIDLAIVGPDDPLVAGVADAFMDAGIRVFGPRANAAIIEGSKAFSKDLMKKYGIPSAAYETFDNADAALAYLETAKMPIVLKADGLALGKGVLICNTLEEAKEGVKTLMLDKQFGSAGDKIVIEEFMTGREVSVLCFCDGTHIKPMASAQDHKRAKDGDQGLNTGGMGTFSPSPFYTDDVDNVMEACIDGKLDEVELEFDEQAAVCVVLASDGYPEHYDKGFVIDGLDTFKDKEGYYVFHAGTKQTDKGIVTNGGRVLGVTAKGKTLVEARANAYKATEWIRFENKYMRHDIGKAIDEQ